MASTTTSRLPDFYKQTIDERWQSLAASEVVDHNRKEVYQGSEGLTLESADRMIENVIGLYSLPLGLALNFMVNDREVIVPMVVEEPSIVAGASYMAKLARSGGGFKSSADDPVMISQIQLLDIEDLGSAERAIQEHKQEIFDAIDAVDPVIKKLGGGARGLEIRAFPDTPVGPMLVVHLLVDTRDAMGANAINTAAENVAPRLAQLSGGRAHLRILSNLADRRLVRAKCRIPADSLTFRAFSGESVARGIVEAWAFAAVDPYRAATHNKGIMNGIDAVVMATGNDWRAVEAGAHSYAARSGRYSSLSQWSIDDEGALEGSLEMPMAVGIVGGATRVHPVAGANLELMGIKNARQLAEVIAAVGLAQNLAALRALATEGIQRGHMGLHARQVAIAAGASGDTIDVIAEQMIREGAVRIDRAEALLAQSIEANHAEDES